MDQDLNQLLEHYQNALKHFATIPGEIGALARVILDGPLSIMDSPYIITYKTIKNYNPYFGDDRKCMCGHTYDRHFDPYEENAAVGCKYCRCNTFVCESEYKPWKLFLDDERDPIGDDWVICRNIYEVFDECIVRGLPTFVAFDHDLGSNDPDYNNGYSVAHWIINEILNGRWVLPKDFNWYVHSQNPIGAENINTLLNNFMRSQAL